MNAPLDDRTPVWFISGCSTGFGRELARLVIARGWRVAVTARDRARVADLVELAPERAIAFSLDVTQPTQITAAVDAVKERFGRIDVLVNNAGYGYQTSVEEGVEAEIRHMFDANVFGLFALTRAVLPIMRAQRSGRILNITSVAGHVGLPSSAYYAASKHAVEGFGEGLQHEVEPLGIRVVNVAPGPFRTDWAGRSLIQTQNRIEDYAATAGARLQATADISGKQAGDPVRAAEAMIALAEHDNPPLHIVLGKWGIDTVTARLRARVEQIEQWRDTGAQTDFPS